MAMRAAPNCLANGNRDKVPNKLTMPICRPHWIAHLLAAGVAILALWLAAAPVAFGQTTPTSAQFAAWDATANRAKDLIERGDTSRWALEQLREQLAEQRLEAFELSQRVSLQVRTLEAQLSALGPPPSEPDGEPEDIAARRAELNAAIGEARTPTLKASEAFERASLLISEVDAVLRGMRTADLLTQYPSPLSLDRWPAMIGGIAVWGHKIFTEAPSSVASNVGRLALFGALMVAALVLTRTIQRLALRKLNAALADGMGPLVALFAINVVRLVLPALAATAVVLAWREAGPALPGLGFLAPLAPDIAIDLVLAYWLGHVVFSPHHADYRLIALDEHAAKEGYLIALAIGIVSAVEIVISAIDRYSALSAGSVSLLALPLIMVASALFWRLAFNLTLGSAKPAVTESEPTATAADPAAGANFLGLLGLAIRLGSIVIVAALLFGYTRLSLEVFDATVETIAVLALALVLFHGVMLALSELLKKDQEAEAEQQPTLLPILLVMVLTVGIVPILAVIWGAQIDDIAEAWRALADGVEVGGVRLSIDGVLILIVVFAGGLVATRFVQRSLRADVLPRTRMDLGAQNALVTGVGYAGVTLATVIALSSAGVNLSSLAIVAGALSIGIGFGLQTIVANFVSGIILLIERPIKQGDWIEVMGYSGHVRKVSVRSTRIETFDKQDVIIPNADLISGTVTNLTLTNKMGRAIIPVGVAYGTEVQRVREILLEAAQEHRAILRHPAPLALFIRLGDSALEFELRCYLRDVNDRMSVMSELLTTIYEALRAENIEIPFPQRDLHVRTLPPEVAPQATAGDTEAADRLA